MEPEDQSIGGGVVVVVGNPQDIAAILPAGRDRLRTASQRRSLAASRGGRESARLGARRGRAVAERRLCRGQEEQRGGRDNGEERPVPRHHAISFSNLLVTHVRGGVISSAFSGGCGSRPAGFSGRRLGGYRFAAHGAFCQSKPAGPGVLSTGRSRGSMLTLTHHRRTGSPFFRVAGVRWFSEANMTVTGPVKVRPFRRCGPPPGTLRPSCRLARESGRDHRRNTPMKLSASPVESFAPMRTRDQVGPGAPDAI